MGDTVSERKAWDPTPDKRGLECSACGCEYFRVVYTRTAWGGHIVRRRERDGCGRRTATWERMG